MKPELSKLLKFDEEGKETAAGTVLKRKGGKQFKSQGKRHKAPALADGKNGSLEVAVEKSSDTISISDDRPLTRWFKGTQDQPSATLENQLIENVKSPLAVKNGQNLSFEKHSTLWALLESSELFQMIPQNPHFTPLDNKMEFTREAQAISKMVSYLYVVDATSKLKLEDPRGAFEDNLEALVELESDVKAVRDCLTGLVLIKEKEEELEEQLRKVKDKLEVERVEQHRFDTEIEVIDKQMMELLEKRDQMMKNKEKKIAEVDVLEAEVEDINEGMSKFRCNFYGLAASLSVSKQQTPA